MRHIYSCDYTDKHIKKVNPDSDNAKHLNWFQLRFKCDFILKKKNTFPLWKP